MVGGVRTAQQALGFQSKTAAQIHTLGRIDVLLHIIQGQGGPVGDIPGQCCGGLGQLGIGHHPVKDAQLQGFLCGHPATGEVQLLGPCRSHQLAEQPAAAVIPRKSNVAVASSHKSRLTGDAQITGEGDAKTGARRDTRQHRYRRFGELVQTQGQGFLALDQFL